MNTCTATLRDIVELALLTGARKGELLALQWDDIRAGFVHIKTGKTGDPRQIPISAGIEAVLKRLRKRRELKDPCLFTYRGKPVVDVKTAFNAAVKRAGLVGVTFHTLRHTFCSHLVMNGESLRTVQELLGHRSLAMVLRYSHLSEAHKRDAVSKLDGLVGFQKKDFEGVTKVSHFSKPEK